MANETITFSCQVCGSKLTVPDNLAGVTGPCPTCQTMIQAPLTARDPDSGVPVAVPVFQAAPTVLRPEPRQLPTRTSPADSFAKQMPAPNYSNLAFNEVQPPLGHSGKNRLIRVLTPILFLMASVAIGFGVATLLKRQARAAYRNVSVARGDTRPILQDRLPASVPDDSSQQDLVPVSDQSSFIEPVPTLPAGLEPKTPGEVSKDVLDKFLAAKTLAERLPLMETQTPGSELAKSCLAGPLPEATNFRIGAVENNAVEQVVDFYHQVDFDAGDNRTDPHTILVRIRGSAEPKVVVDPFLDSYGGRLADYAKSPSDKAEFFQVIVWPLASCYDERVPNHDKKLTLKLLPQVDAKEIALAYFGRQSKIAQMLQDGTYSVAYNKAKACTVMLRWNTEDSPEMPYLEAVALRTLDWNP